MKNKIHHGPMAEGQARPKVVLTLFLFTFSVLLVIFLSMKEKRPEQTLQPPVMVRVVSIDQPETAQTPQAKIVTSEFAPETVSALMSVGLSTTNLAGVSVGFIPRPPVILQNTVTAKVQ
jgi:hypothetical protein